MRFLLIDRITSLTPGKAATAIKCVALSEDFFDDHFPLKPILPGVLIAEGLAQLSGALLRETVNHGTTTGVKALLSIIERMKFRQTVRPGDTLQYESEIESLNDAGARVSVRALVDGAVAAEGRLVYSFHEYENPQLEDFHNRLMSLWTRKPEAANG